FFIEPMNIRSIAAIKQTFETGDLRRRLARYHDHVDAAFYGWNTPWLAFHDWRLDDEGAHIRVPILIVQREGDAYGTMAQVTFAQERAYSPVEVLMLKDCGHSPHLDQPDATLAAVTEYVRHLLAAHEGLMPAA